nr:immunoglobulin light chain junction region [Macaca mulatta]MOV73588.1 immunoglobulin light chain junction region [Macaca mulatta]
EYYCSSYAGSYTLVF